MQFSFTYQFCVLTNFNYPYMACYPHRRRFRTCTGFGGLPTIEWHPGPHTCRRCALRHYCTSTAPVLPRPLRSRLQRCVSPLCVARPHPLLHAHSASAASSFPPLPLRLSSILSRVSPHDRLLPSPFPSRCAKRSNAKHHSVLPSLQFRLHLGPSSSRSNLPFHPPTISLPLPLGPR